MGPRTERGNGIATTDIIGIGRNTETVLTTMFITEAVILKGEETMKEMATGGIDLDQGAGIADLDLVLVQEVFKIRSSILYFSFTSFTDTHYVELKQQFNPLVIQPQAMTQQTVAIYFNQVMAAIGGNTAGPGDAIHNVYINHDKKFAFVEMRSVEEASNAIALDGILFEGSPVKVRRPTDYNPSLAAALGPNQPSPNLNLSAVGLTAGSAGGLEGPDRIFVDGLPNYFTEDQVRELLESFGPLRGFDLVKDRETAGAKSRHLEHWTKTLLSDEQTRRGHLSPDQSRKVSYYRHSNRCSYSQVVRLPLMLGSVPESCSCEQKLVYKIGALPTKVVCLTQVVSADELKDDEEYEDIMEDMRIEAGKYGNLVKVVIPRPDPSGQPVAGVGKVFLEYADVDGAAKAKTALHGRKFGGNPVVAVFYAEDKFANEEYDG
ncbi:unnamed protein product [Miscanthus lutarioriparius]|uniref:U2 snRNP auxiliary factor large subunit n=1 Tax=Miscanthus lutarioriparius TaxID=422564 RepID=A0A811Q9R9_9POAL|nr:unnamed protein product [Miscanthus lutarioriparius]